MKRQITAALTAAFILGGLAACGNSDATAAGGAGDESAQDKNAQDESTQEESAQEESAEKVRYSYGEAEIPDIPCGNGSFEGKADCQADSEDSIKLQQALGSMVFETHTFGDYTVSLVGDSVRTDEANFPGSIYVQNLRVEVERNGVIIENNGRYNDTCIYVNQCMTEYRLFENKLGSYLDVYDLDCPVVAMRYYFDGNPERVVVTAVEFAVIQEDEFCSGFTGVFEEGLGVMLNPDGDGSRPSTMLSLNSTDQEVCRMGIFGSDEFIAADGKTLIDEEAGIRYTFDFSDPLPFELFTAEKIK